MSLRDRVRRLERDADLGGCPACRDRRRLDVLRSGRGLPDGTVVPDEALPPPCSRCGETPERVVVIAEAIVGPDNSDRQGGIPQRR